MQARNRCGAPSGDAALGVVVLQHRDASSCRCGVSVFGVPVLYDTAFEPQDEIGVAGRQSRGPTGQDGDETPARDGMG